MWGHSMHFARNHPLREATRWYVPTNVGPLKLRAMAAITVAEVNPTLLAWAREQSGYASETVPQRGSHGADSRHRHQP